MKIIGYILLFIGINITATAVQAFDQENTFGDENFTMTSLCSDDCEVELMDSANGTTVFLNRNGIVVGVDFTSAHYGTQTNLVPLPPPGGSGVETVTDNVRGASGGELGTFYITIIFTFTGGTVTRAEVDSHFIPDSDLPCDSNCDDE